MDSYIKFMGSDGFHKKRQNNKLSRNQLLAYRDFQNNFNEKVGQAEQQFQMPIEKVLSKREQVNLYSAHIKDKFTVKEFAEKTNMNQNTSRREIQSAIKRGLIEKVERKHAKELQEYRYK